MIILEQIKRYTSLENINIFDIISITFRGASIFLLCTIEHFSLVKNGSSALSHPISYFSFFCVVTTNFRLFRLIVTENKKIGPINKKEKWQPTIILWFLSAMRLQTRSNRRNKIYIFITFTYICNVYIFKFVFMCKAIILFC